MNPLVSILIPAYNAEPWLGDAIQSALDQSWPHTEILVVNDGSKDRTLEVAERFASNKVRVFTHSNRGASATRNRALCESRGDYIQWLDADDVLDRDKIALQLSGGYLKDTVLLSSAWARYYYRPTKARFRYNALCCNHTPISWMLTKMETNAWMAIESWLVSRHLAEIAGPWDVDLSADDDGEYFARIVCASSTIKYVPDAKSRCRLANPQSLSKGTRSPRWLESQFNSIQKQIQYLRKLEDSPRTRRACLLLLRRWYVHFYPNHPVLVQEANLLACKLGGELEVPKLRWKYRWLVPIAGMNRAKSAQFLLPKTRAWLDQRFDFLLHLTGL